MNKVKKRLETLTHSGKNVYIIPSQGGFKYIFINFTLFLISLSYANNMALIITFLMVAYLILQMLDVHRLIQEIDFNDFTITDDHISSEITGILRLNSFIPKNYHLINIEFILKNNTKVEAAITKKINQNTFQFKIQPKKRGCFEIERIRFHTRGSSNLFYVWRSFKQFSIFYAYPHKKISKMETSNSQDPAVFNITEEEFSHHIPYVAGLNSKRIDWKVFARKDQLQWKKHIDYTSKTVSINFSNQIGSTEEKLEQMSFLIDKYFKAGSSWKIVLPNKIIETGKGIKHYKDSMESISEF